MAIGDTADASENGMTLLCTRVTRKSPIRPDQTDRKRRFLSPAQVSSIWSSSVAKVNATEFCSYSAPTMVTGVPFATRS